MAKETKSKLAVDEDLIRQLAGLLDDTGLGEIEVQEGDSKIRVAKGGSTVVAAPAAAAPVASAPASAPAAAPTPEDVAAHPGALTSPMVGVCYLASDPSSPPFCKVGDTVNEGDTILLIEAMKVFNPITAHKSGTISQLLVQDGTPVEFGEPLAIIE
jgi:acetyl-CoA carboxylase biotin carboxyl carrier protein